jgi:hypothetical protein
MEHVIESNNTYVGEELGDVLTPTPTPIEVVKNKVNVGMRGQILY